MPVDPSIFMNPRNDGSQPSARPYTPRIQVETAGGIRSSHQGDRLLISGASGKGSSPAGSGSNSGSASSSVEDDPLAYMSLRAKVTASGSDRFVQVNQSYVDSVYYVDGGWKHEEFTIASETLPISIFPQYLYLKFPVIWVSARDMFNLSYAHHPIAQFVSDEYTINGAGYIFSLDYGTGYLTRNRNVTPDNYFVLQPNFQDVSSNPLQPLPGASNNYTGYFWFYIGTATEGGFQQVSLGIKTLPQAFEFRLTDLTVDAV